MLGNCKGISRGMTSILQTKPASIWREAKFGDVLPLKYGKVRSSHFGYQGGIGPAIVTPDVMKITPNLRFVAAVLDALLQQPECARFCNRRCIWDDAFSTHASNFLRNASSTSSDGRANADCGENGIAVKQQRSWRQWCRPTSSARSVSASLSSKKPSPETLRQYEIL